MKRLEEKIQEEKIQEEKIQEEKVISNRKQINESKKFNAKKKGIKRTRGPVIVKYSPELSKKRKRKFGMLKKVREYSIIGGKSVMTIIQGNNNKYEVYLTHEDLLYDFDFDNISKIVVGNPKIYEAWNNVLRTKSKKVTREFHPKTVLNEKNPIISDERYLHSKRIDFLKKEINDKIFK